MSDEMQEADSPAGTPEPLTEIGNQPIKHILEAALLAADEPLSVSQMKALFEESAQPATGDIGRALEQLAADCADRGVELREVASGFRLQVKPQLQEWVARLWTERPARYSRALMETLALIAYRQPITRGEIESVRGVSLSSNIIRTLQEREWIRIVGHRDVPGKPALFGTTKAFLDYFDLKTLDELPTLAELRDMEALEPELEFEASEGTDADEGAADADAADTGEEPELDSEGDSEQDPASPEAPESPATGDGNEAIEKNEVDGN
jgi:segregation and condensation protein B